MRGKTSVIVAWSVFSQVVIGWIMDTSPFGVTVAIIVSIALLWLIWR